MPFSKRWRFTRPTPALWVGNREQFLLDMAYLVVLPPLLMLIKAPMLLFLVLVFILLLRAKKAGSAQLLLVGLVGIVAIYLCLYGAFNAAGLSRLKLFVELMIYVLLLAVSLQRLSRVINFYLRLSPLLLLALSLFFFDSAAMLAYVIFEIFMLLWLILAYRMHADALASLRMTGMLFALSLPWVTLLFLFFPRISFEHASYGFHGDEIRRTGHDGTMYLDRNALLVPSERIVMEVGFRGSIPEASKLYFRGSVLYRDMKDHWEPLRRRVKRRFEPKQNIHSGMTEVLDEITAYKVSLYPTYKRWLYLLDLPVEAPTGATIDADFETTLVKAIDEPQHYDAGSALRYRYGAQIEPEVLKAALEVNSSANPRTRQEAHRIASAYTDPQKRLEALIDFFRRDDLTYTLRPEALDLNHSTDSFLFDKRRGYCVHFASSFATMARLAGLASRIVTGYKPDRSNSVNTYLAVKERDAHAWTEVYIDDHWLRIDPTATAAHIDPQSAELLRQGSIFSDADSRWIKVNLYLLYAKYQVETWILQYSHFRQMQLLDAFKNRPGAALTFALSFLGLLTVSLALFAYLRRPRCGSGPLCLLRPLLRKLQREGYTRHHGETLHRLFARYRADHPEAKGLDAIDRLYHRWRYADAQTKPSQLRQLVRNFLKSTS